MSRILSMVVVLLALGWVVLFFSGKAVLINETSPTSNGVVQSFTCTYFDGMKMLKKEQVFGDIPLMGQVGSARCQRLIDLDGQPVDTN